MNRATVGRLVVLLLAVAVLVPVCTADAATITGCVNKKTGELRVKRGKAAKKKCPRGWTKVKWNTRGPAGQQGLPGANGTNGANGQPAPVFNLKDASGAIVGQLLGYLPEGGAIYFVLRDGGIYLYIGSGQLYTFGGSPEFKTSDCSGTAYLKVSSEFTPATFAALVGGPFRVVFRTFSSGTFGPATAWKGTSTTESVASTQLYRRDSDTGVCTADSSLFTGDLVALEQVTAPPDFTGPLTIG